MKYLSRSIPFFNIDKWQMPIMIDPEIADTLPLMYNQYVGLAFLFLSIPIALVFNILHIPFSEYIFLTIIGLLSLWGIYYSISYLFGRLCGFITLFLTAVNLTYIHTIHQIFIREEVFQITGLWLGIACLCKAHETNHRRWTYTAFFIFGFTLWAKLMFLGYIFGGLFALIAVRPHKLGRILKSIAFKSKKTTLACIISFCTGAAPLFYVHTKLKFNVFQMLMESLFNKHNSFQNGPDKTWNNLDLLNNIPYKINDLINYTKGTLYLNIPFPYSSFFTYLFFIAFAWAIARILFTKNNSYLRYSLAFIISAYTVLMILSCFVLGCYTQEHIIIMVPFCEILCALFLCDIAKIKPRLIGYIAITTVLAIRATEQTTIISQFIKHDNSHYYYKSQMLPIKKAVREIGENKLLYSYFVGWGMNNLFQDLPITIITDSCIVPFLDSNPDNDWYLMSLPDEDTDIITVLQNNNYSLEPIKTFDHHNDTAVIAIHKIIRKQNC